MIKPAKSNRTLAHTAYDRLRADLLACRLVPGEAIKIKEISLLLGTNPIAIREALSKLTAEGLVTAEAQKGFRAAPISETELRDLTAVRVEIECICLRLAMEAGDVEWETGIVAALHRLLRGPVRVVDVSMHTGDEWIEYHRLFHDALAQACGSPLLLGFRAKLFDQAERYRVLSAPYAASERDLDSEHKELAEAALSRNLPVAMELMSRHLRMTADILLDNNAPFRVAAAPAVGGLLQAID